MNRKNFIILIFLLITVTAFFHGCGGNPATPESADPVLEETPEPAPEETPEPLITGGVEVTENSIQYEYKADDGTVVLTLSISLPKIENPGELQAINIINDYYGQEMEDHIAYAETILYYIAKNNYSEMTDMGLEFTPRQSRQSFTVEHNQDDRLSITRIYTDFSGAYEGDAIIKAQTFDTRKGGQIIADDLFSVSDGVYTERILGEILSQIEAAKGTDGFSYYENYRELIRTCFQKDNFYLTDKSMVFYYQPYSIADGSSGVRKFEISYDILSDILK